MASVAPRLAALNPYVTVDVFSKSLDIGILINIFYVVAYIITFVLS